MSSEQNTSNNKRVFLTGVGIMGTFLGSLRGLSMFSVRSDPETVRVSLDTLIQGVREAFYVSAVVIALAMLTTFAEKLIVTRHIIQVEELCQLLDSLFEAGAGEEYLARLVNAGESSTTQSAQLKVTKTVSEEQRVAGARKNAIEKLLDQVEQAAKKDPKFSSIHVNRDRQMIDFGDRARFDTVSHQLNKDQARLLRAFIPHVLEIANSDLGKDWLKRIVVEGFADKRGSYLLKLRKPRPVGVEHFGCAYEFVHCYNQS